MIWNIRLCKLKKRMIPANEKGRSGRDEAFHFLPAWSWLRTQPFHQRPAEASSFSFCYQNWNPTIIFHNSESKTNQSMFFCWVFWMNKCKEFPTMLRQSTGMFHQFFHRVAIKHHSLPSDQVWIGGLSLLGDKHSIFHLTNHVSVEDVYIQGQW